MKDLQSTATLLVLEERWGVYVELRVEQYEVRVLACHVLVNSAE
jgi:hypothetical protein